VSEPPFDGTHLLADLYGCVGLDDPALIERALRDAVAAGGATLLEIRVHHFGEGTGVTGFALLAESHISIHTWPELGYAAVDLFLCGRRHDVEGALRALAEPLAPQRFTTQFIARGYGSAV
jgi:S-adenosylmethionine decarboxylase